MYCTVHDVLYNEDTQPVMMFLSFFQKFSYRYRSVLLLFIIYSPLTCSYLIKYENSCPIDKYWLGYLNLFGNLKEKIDK